jgi:Tol biopolymer transport system component
VVNPNGTVTNLPIYSGTLAPGPQRVVSDTGVFVFTSAQPSATGSAGPTDVYTANLDGTGVRNATRSPAPSFSAQNAVISADGQTIAFEQNSQIFAIAADGTGLRQFGGGPQPATNPSLSADGSKLTYTQSGPDHHGISKVLSTPQPVAR